MSKHHVQVAKDHGSQRRARTRVLSRQDHHSTGSSKQLRGGLVQTKQRRVTLLLLHVLECALQDLMRCFRMPRI